MRRVVKASETPQAEIDKFWHRKFNLTSFLFDKQLAFVEDPASYKIAVCSRRSGKTVACAADLIHTAINNAGVVCLYITLAASNARKLVWPELKKINDNSKLDGKVNEIEGSITFRNGSIVYISGAKDQAEIEKFRGLALKKVYIDECQSFRAYIKDLIDDILEPALLDHAGTLCLIGTPGPLPVGYFYECSQNKEVWSSHHWTFFDNFMLPAIRNEGKTHQQLLDRVLKRRKLTASDLPIQREYFGRWVVDSNSLVFRYNAAINDFDALAPEPPKWHYILGVDVGFNDSDAICVLAWNENDPAVYLVEEKIEPKQGITELADQIKVLQVKYNPDKIIMDMGALGKKIGEEIIRRHQIPVEAADKTRKMENIELLNDALRRGHFKAKANSRFAQDSYLVEIDRDKSTPERLKISDRFHSDILDAALYAFKVSPAYAWEPPPPPPPKPGTPEWAKQQVDDMFESALDHFQREESIKAWNNGESGSKLPKAA